MGKGDRKSKKGKIAKGSFGVRRPKKPKHDVALNPPAETKKPAKKTKTTAKKSTAKKSTKKKEKEEA